MELLVLDAKFDAIATVDSYISSIWTVRFNEVGDFELVLAPTKKNLDLSKIDLYLWNRDSDRLMIIDTVLIEGDAEEGPTIELTGESLESILKRRIVSEQTILSGSVQMAIKKLIDENVISPKDGGRHIPGFSFKESTDKAITNLYLSKETSFHGETVYEAVETLCKEKKIGFKVLPKGEGGFEFELYVGEDRSYSQEENPYVVFSPKMENLLGSNYCKSHTDYRNAAYSIGTWQQDIIIPSEDGQSTQTYTREWPVKVWAYPEDKFATGLARREMFLDNGDLSGDDHFGNQSKWNDLAATKAKEEMRSHEVTEVIDGELQAGFQYIYGEDFFIGDIVQVVTEFGKESRSYISEIVFSSDGEGDKIVPTFTSTEEEE